MNILVFYMIGNDNSPLPERVLAEQPIYGIDRLGVLYRSQMLSSPSWDGYNYELTDHLGNVRAIITKTITSSADVQGSTDYYPFGMPMPDRKVTDVNNYRYAYQGQEKDPETGKEAFELRLWDGRIGRWLSPDPSGQYYSPYLGMGNNPINGIDSDGGTWHPVGAAIKLWEKYKNFLRKTKKGRKFIDDIENNPNWHVTVRYRKLRISKDGKIDGFGYDEETKTLYISDITDEFIKMVEGSEGSIFKKNYWKNTMWVHSPIVKQLASGHEVKHAWDHYDLARKLAAMNIVYKPNNRDNLKISIRKPKEESAVKFQNYLSAVYGFSESYLRSGYGSLGTFWSDPTNSQFNPNSERVYLPRSNPYYKVKILNIPSTLDGFKTIKYIIQSSRSNKRPAGCSSN